MMMMNQQANPASPSIRRAGIWAVLAVVAVTATASGQTFSSGSDGSDGALNLPAGSGTVIFDPFDTTRWGRVLDADGDGIYNFTTITIGGGRTLRLRGDKVNRPIYFLSSGDVLIQGTLDLSGACARNDICADGTPQNTTDLDVRRRVATPGSGGFAGGAGGRSDIPGVNATSGQGPGGGAGGVTSGGPCNTSNVCGRGGTFTGNRYLIPLFGGSGGEGARWSGGFYGGGAGGGAVLIASSSSITVTGSINASGGYAGGNVGGGGSGGGIRLVAPTLAGSGQLNVSGGPGQTGPAVAGRDGSPGRARLEGYQVSASLTFNPVGAGSVGTPGLPSTLRPFSFLRVVTIDGVPMAPNPSGMFQVPDVVIEKDQPVDVDIEATGIPPGTIVTLQVYPEIPVDETTVYLAPVQATLTGTLQSSTATATVTFPFGYSRGSVHADW